MAKNEIDSTSSSSSSTPLVPAISPDGSLVAIVVPQYENQAEQQEHEKRIENGATLERIIPTTIQIYQVDTGLLQMTLNSRGKFQGLLQENLDNHKSDSNSHIKNIYFCGTQFLIAHTTKKIFIWDLVRGGISAHLIDADENQKKKSKKGTDYADKSEKQVIEFLDMQTTAQHVFVLVSISDEEESKLRIHLYDPSSGALVRKIKCGTLENKNEFGIAIMQKENQDEEKEIDSVDDYTGGYVALVRGCHSSTEAFRMIDIETGDRGERVKFPTKQDGGAKSPSKSKKKKRKSIDSATVDYGDKGCGIFCNRGIVSVPREKTICFYNLNEMKFVEATIPLSPSQAVQMETHKKSNLSMAGYGCFVNENIYSIPITTSEKGLPVIAKIDFVEKLQKAHLLHSCKKWVTIVYRHVKLNGAEPFQIRVLDADKVKKSGKKEPSTIEVGWDGKKEINEEDDQSKKRNREEEDMTTGAVGKLKHLGPGQAGLESMDVSTTPTKKKTKNNNVPESANDGDATTNQTIEERLKQLAQTMNAMDEEEEEEEEDSFVNETNKKLGEQLRDDAKDKKSKTNNITTDSLKYILVQGLKSNDDTLLNLAWSSGLRDQNVLRKTLRELSTLGDKNNSYIHKLVDKLVYRLAHKPQVAFEIVIWLKQIFALLLSMNSQSEASDKLDRLQMQQLLQPLMNLIQERIEIFQSLLQLDGRLSY